VLVPHGGYIFPGFDLNHSYTDCDAFVSMTKLKEHGVTGVTLSLKNCFGITPATIYGTGAGEDEPTELRAGPHNHPFGRAAALPERAARAGPHDAAAGRVPDSARRGGPGIGAARGPGHRGRSEDMTGGEGPWGRGEKSAVSPGVLVAGTNPVNTDAFAWR